MQCDLYLKPTMWLMLVAFLRTFGSTAQNVYDIVFLEFIILIFMSSIHFASAAAAFIAFRLKLGLAQSGWREIHSMSADQDR